VLETGASSNAEDCHAINQFLAPLKRCYNKHTIKQGSIQCLALGMIFDLLSLPRNSDRV